MEYLSYLNSGEKELYYWAYNKYCHPYNFDAPTTKKQIKANVKRWRDGNWPKKVVSSLEFYMIAMLDKQKIDKEKYERKQYAKLHRKYGDRS